MLSTLEKIENIHDLSENITDKKLQIALRGYSLHYIDKNNDLISNIIQNQKESNVIVIDHYQETDQNIKILYFIICFKKTIIIIKQQFITILLQLFSMNKEIEYCFLKNTKQVFEESIKTDYKETKYHDFFENELNAFKEFFHFKPSEDTLICEIWKIISSCFFSYLIEESYFKSNKNRYMDFYWNKNNKYSERTINDDDDYIELRIIEFGSFIVVSLIYHIEDEKLYAIKKQQSNDNDEVFKLKNREINNYKNISHPNISNFYGITSKNHLVLEYINGQTLSNVDISKYSKEEKLSIIIQILSIFKYLHKNHFIYRDLKPNNIMIDSNKTAVLIDFDRMINENEINNDDKRTIDFCSEYIAPEINSGKFTNKCDIYSIGKIIIYILCDQKSILVNEYTQLKTIINQCFEETIDKRPSISELISHFKQYLINQNIILANIDRANQFEIGKIYLNENKIKEAFQYFYLSSNQNYQDAQFNLGLIYYEGKYIERDINKSIHYFLLAANQNYQDAQFNLGMIYYEGEYIERDINKSIHYLTLAANQNYQDAQFNLGIIYYEGKYIERDINKSIYYYSLAANQNYQDAQFNLGMIYYEGEYIERDINKSIHYLTLAANQNYLNAQYNLGLIYYEGEYIERDINKSIHYYSLAANQNYPNAQFNLGMIYYEGKYIERDINKSIHYFSLAANQNYPLAQNNLGLIYYEGKYIERDINKSIHYLTLAADQNYPNAQFNLGLTYYEGEYIERYINKSIHYLTLAADQNYPNAQFYLGLIYYEGKYMERDINKSIYYYSLAANQNYQDAQYNLGIIYYEGEYIERDINKSIHYYSLAANQNNQSAQYNLGIIYYEDKYVTRDINKSIYYYSLAANQNNQNAQCNLGIIYYEGKYIKRDINKSIQYLIFAANQNSPLAQCFLGLIYCEGERIVRDISKSIYYYSLSANQNYPIAQANLGSLYYNGIYIQQDIKKSIYYFSLAANQNYPKAQYFLGIIYFEDIYIAQDINKSIHYLTLAANQNYQDSQFKLGSIYYEGKYIAQNIKKSIHYLLLAAIQNHRDSQFLLGYILYNDLKKKKGNLRKGIYWITKSSENGNVRSNFFLGFLYHEGKYVTKNIKKSIHYYKEASSFNDQYSKNNLGIIYKHGIDDEIEKNIANADIYFKEAINQKKDPVSMYNLAHLYIYEEQTEESINKSIDLLIDSINLKFYESSELLLIVLFRKYDGNLELVKKDLKKRNNIDIDNLFSRVSNNNNNINDEPQPTNIIPLESHDKINKCTDIINNQDFEYVKKDSLNENIIDSEYSCTKGFNNNNSYISLLSNPIFLQDQYEKYKCIDFMYDQSYKIIPSKIIFEPEVLIINTKMKDGNEDFYEGFGCNT